MSVFNTACTCGEPIILNKKRNMCTSCYYHWYNTTQRDKKAEQKRQATYRKSFPEKSMCSRFKNAAKEHGIAFDITPNGLKRNWI